MQTFQRYADAVIGDLPFVFVYIDDILIASDSVHTHERHLRIVFECLKKFSLQLNLEKCSLGEPRVNFLDLKISENGCRPLEGKVRSIVEYSRTKTVK